MQAVLNPNPKQTKNPYAKSEVRDSNPHLHPVVPSALAVIAALELTPLPQTIRGNYLLICFLSSFKYDLVSK